VRSPEAVADDCVEYSNLTILLLAPIENFMFGPKTPAQDQAKASPCSASDNISGIIVQDFGME
jgi:hypothetical protein